MNTSASINIKINNIHYRIIVDTSGQLNIRCKHENYGQLWRQNISGLALFLDEKMKYLKTINIDKRTNNITMAAIEEWDQCIGYGEIKTFYCRSSKSSKDDLIESDTDEETEKTHRKGNVNTELSKTKSKKNCSEKTSKKLSQHKIFAIKKIMELRIEHPGKPNDEYIRLAAEAWNRYKEETDLGKNKEKFEDVGEKEIEDGLPKYQNEKILLDSDKNEDKIELATNENESADNRTKYISKQCIINTPYNDNHDSAKDNNISVVSFSDTDNSSSISRFSYQIFMEATRLHLKKRYPGRPRKEINMLLAGKWIQHIGNDYVYDHSIHKKKIAWRTS